MTDVTGEQGNVQRLFSQVEAARYLGVSVRWFRAHVHVEPIPVGPLLSDRRPLLRYLREELDAVLNEWKSRRAS